MQEIPRGDAHRPMLVVSPSMSASEANTGYLSNLVLARNAIDRASELRTDPSKLDSLWKAAKIVIVCSEKLSATDSELIYFSADQISEPGDRYFLGIDQENGQSFFAFHVASHDEEQLRSLRQVAADLTDCEAALAVHAIALSNWHSSHPHCARCGAPTRAGLGGAVRICTVDESEHYPRTDPAVIVLIKDVDDRILLGHQPVWPENRYSTFAGFLEPGESFEQCVVREVAEESGVKVHTIKYLGSQPWPFPASIMIAFEAITSEPLDAKPDGQEISDVKWFSREEFQIAIRNGSLILPPRISVSRRMVEYWFGGEIESGESWRP
jgi:NAD+ diphosphatase